MKIELTLPDSLIHSFNYDKFNDLMTTLEQDAFLADDSYESVMIKQLKDSFQKAIIL